MAQLAIVEMDESHSKTNCESDDSINSFLYFSYQTIICPQERDIKSFVSPVVEVADRNDRDWKPFSDKVNKQLLKFLIYIIIIHKHLCGKNY